MTHLIDIIDAVIFFTPVAVAAAVLGWFALGLVMPRWAR